MMNKPEFIAKLRAEHAAWESLIAEAGAARMTLPGAAGFWCFKDVVAHVTAYERWLVDLFAAVKCGELPAPSIWNDPDLENRNAVVYEVNKDKSVEVVLAESREVFNPWRNRLSR